MVVALQKASLYASKASLTPNNTKVKLPGDPAEDLQPTIRYYLQAKQSEKS